METTIARIEGTHCRACKALIEDVCKDIMGVKACTVNFETGETTIEHEKNLDWNLLKREVESLGKYKLIIKNDELR